MWRWLRQLRHGDAMSAVLHRGDGIAVGLDGLGREFILDHSEAGGRRRVVQRQPRQIDAGRDDPLVVIWVDADQVLLQIEGVLTVLLVFEFVFVQVRPSPQTRVDHVRETLAGGHLQTTVQRPLV